MQVEKSGGTVVHVYACDTETLVYLVGQNTITPHVWLSRADRLRQPDRIVFDLDPAPGERLRRRAPRRPQHGRAAARARARAVRAGDGSKGIHVWTPLRRRAGFDDVRPSRATWRSVLADRHPDELTMEFRKSKRGGRILVDTTRNTYAQTAVPPYAVRPLPGAPVATPIDWEELSDSKLRADRWTVKNVLSGWPPRATRGPTSRVYARGISRPAAGSTHCCAERFSSSRPPAMVAAMSFDSSR